MSLALRTLQCSIFITDSVEKIVGAINRFRDEEAELQRHCVMFQKSHRQSVLQFGSEQSP